MRSVRFLAVLPLLLLLAVPTVAQDAVPTQVTVRAVSNDAKLIQDPVGGAHITIEHAETGEVLAEGRQSGDSGSTEKIMRQPHERGASIYEAPGAAKYETTLDLAEPTRVRVAAEGPLDYPHAMQQTSKTVLLMPGEDVAGDGITLTLHGFIVEVLKPSASEVDSGEEVSVRARVQMMCGCPTKPGGLWDATRYTIRAQLLREGAVVAEGPLSFAGTTNEYEGALSVPGAGADQVRVTATDADRVNFGMATTSLNAE
ncbi:hypothetical protein [Salinibacter altiplanensis]|uniref:hypothetical protein n=1 Tax=Salinibacter altiplanensis TaxID=1803181 RepID=UPI000C9EE538|nr:hypothetical protein [Salinibacter altiplanensis]